MANKFDKIYRNIIKIDENKVREIITKAEELDTQEMLQYSLINKIPLALVTNSDGNNLIHLAINNSSKIKNEFNKLNFIKFLIQNNVNPDQPNKENQTPLHLACEKQYATIVEYLIDLHANINYQDNNGFTPLHYLLTGDIKPWEEKEIKEFIVPTPKIKETAEERKALLELKKEIWDNIKNEDFFNLLQHSIQKFLTDEQFNDEIIKLKSELASAKEDFNLINNIYLNYKKKLFEYIEKKWDGFKDSPDIELINYEENSYSIDNKTSIIKNYDLKQNIKKNLSTNVKEINKLINEYNFKINSVNLIESISLLLSDILWDNIVQDAVNAYDDRIFPQDVYIIKNRNIIDDLSNLYNQEKDKNAYDLADNITNLKELSFIGGSRLINIINNNYDQLRPYLYRFNNNNKINKQVVFILLIEYIQTLVDLDNVLPNIFDIINNFDFNTDYNNLFNNLIIPPIPIGQLTTINIIKEIYKNIFIDRLDNIGPIVYCKYVNFVLSNNQNNLVGDIHILFCRLISALNNYETDLENSLFQVLKIDNFWAIITYPIPAGAFVTDLNFINGLCNWMEFLFRDNSGNDNDKILEITRIINGYNFETLIINSKVITNEILKIYNKMSNKFPKLYLLDLIYYIMNPEVLKTIIINNRQTFNDHFNILEQMIDEQIINEQYIPSFSGYIHIILEKKKFDIGQWPGILRYYQAKLRESIELGLLFNGCLPNLMEPIIEPITRNNYFNIKLIKQNSNRSFIFNPLVVGYTIQQPNYFIDSIPLPFNYYFNPNPIRGALNINQIYFRYEANQYRPPYVKSKQYVYENQINNYNIVLQKILKDYKEILNSFLKKKQHISSIYYDLYIKSRIIINKEIKIKNNLINNVVAPNPDEIKLFDFDKFIKILNNINVNIYFYYYFYKKEIPTFSFYNLDTGIIMNQTEDRSDNYLLYDKNSPNNEIDLDQIGGSIPLLESLGSSETYENLDFINEFYIGMSPQALAIHKGEKERRLESFPNDKESLPPALKDNLNDFYQYNKIFLIVNFLKNNIDLNNIKNKYPTLITKNKSDINDYDAFTILDLRIAKLIEEIIKDYAIYATNIAVYNKLQDLREIKKNIKVDKTTIIQNFQITTILYKPENSINIDETMIPNFSDPDINKNCDFIIYPNEYTNTTLLKQKYCIYINPEIIDFLLKIKFIKPLLLDNNNNSCIIPVLSSFNSSIFKKINSYKIQFNDNKYIHNELNNHKNKLFNENFIKIFENFTKSQFEEIKVLILSDESNGNNLLFTLKNSFYICFYIINEYLTDYLWDFNENYKIEDFKNILLLLKYNEDNINKSYLNNFANEHRIFLFQEDSSLTNNDFIKNCEKKIDKLNKHKNQLLIEKESFEQIKLTTKIEKIVEDIKKIDEDIKKIDKDIIKKKKNINIYIEKNIEKIDIIKTYDKILEIGNGVYLSIWNLLFNFDSKINKCMNILKVWLTTLGILDINFKNTKKILTWKQYNDFTQIKTLNKIEIDNCLKQLNIEIPKEVIDKTDKNDDDLDLSDLFKGGGIQIFDLESSFNLSLLQILKEKPNTNVEKYFDHISEVAHTYFNIPKYYGVNKTLNFINNLLIHLTKTNICYGIEIVVRKVIFDYLTHKFVNYTVYNIYIIIDNIIDGTNIYITEASFKLQLYNKLPEKLVKNSVYIFRDLDEKVNFESQTVNELLRDLFGLLDKTTYLNDDIINVLNNNIASYFDLFVSRTINNWYVVCENTFKFIINHDRIIKINNLMGVEISNNHSNIKKNTSDNDINEIINKTNKLFDIVENTNEKLKNILTKK
jgi:hypothetical protein